MQATGAVFINDVEVDAGVMRANASYLAGSQLLIPELSVKESLHFVLNFIVPYNTAPEEREYLITEVMNKLNLLNIAGVRVTKLSKEQKVRLNLAQIILQQKDVIFLDEPTKGLDIISTINIINIILDLFKENKFFVSMEHPTKEILYKFDT